MKKRDFCPKIGTETCTVTRKQPLEKAPDLVCQVLTIAAQQICSASGLSSAVDKMSGTGVN